MRRFKAVTVITLAALAFGSSLCSAQDDARKNGVFGFGFGIPYGVLGGNGEVFLTDHVSVAAGIGTTVLAGAGYSAGVRFYLGKSWGPNVSLLYGTNGLADAGAEEYEKYSGLNFGLGQQWLWGENKTHGLDLNLILIATSGVFERIDELKRQGRSVAETGRIKLSVGYRFGA